MFWEWIYVRHDGFEAAVPGHPSRALQPLVRRCTETAFDRRWISVKWVCRCMSLPSRSMLPSLQLAHGFRAVKFRIGKRYRYVQAPAPEPMIDASRRMM